ncbi:flagellar assembly protein FliH [Paraburkholderia bonniea]|uniref:flagellar assembly protein FliH n=1 Tax=Paraburkholderia bonniea TaxID=2152891 RepID=UPI001292669C|nr:flagellar assembly protein FliH [Paraburkholderia bonniea]WJF90468.1 flagellar assembly protein FliH [Paraburkholderia bonniea]WJF93783.1 flagellar assembly protein FliH [Paraburkholderia bonniea]
MSERAPTSGAGLTAYQRWEMASFDPAPPVVEDPLVFERELQRLRDQAHTQGVAAGHVAGQAQGYQAGFEQGQAQGYEQGMAAARAEAAQLTALAQTFNDALGHLQNEVAQTLCALALDIAQQVVRQHVQHDPTALLAAAREVLAAEPALSGAPHLVVNPAELPVIESYLLGELQTRGWSVRTDPTVERGGCRASATSGEVDAGIGTRWERVAAALGKLSTW